jgi:hypothetical protein
MPTLRQKTIRVPVNFGNVPFISNNSLTSIGTPTIYIPENGDADVTFKSVMFFYSWQDTATNIGASGTRIQTITTRLQLFDASGPSSVEINADPLTTMTNSGENQSMTFGPIDYTSYFNTDTGWDSSRTSQVCDVRILMYTDTGITTDWQKIYGWLDITYEYDADAGTSRIQTVCIPYESYNTYMNHLITIEIGTPAQLTGGGGILNGYTDPVVRHRWIEVKGNTYASNEGFYLRYSFDDGSLNDLPAMTGSLSTSLYETYLIDASSLTISESHTFELQASITSRWPSIIVNEWLTFEFTTTDTTRVLNYIEVPLEFETTSFTPNSASNSSFSREVLIPEKNITQLNCAAEINFNSNAGPYYSNIRSGTQEAYKQYLNNSTLTAGAMAFQHRIDTGSSSGGGISLQSGLNNLSLFLYQTTQEYSNISGVIKLLYLSDVSTSGIDNHTQTVKSIIRQPEMVFRGFPYSTIISNTASFYIPNDDYYIQSSGLQYHMLTNSSTMGINIKARILPDEGVGEGYRSLYSDIYYADPELSYTPMYIRARDEFRRYPGDPDSARLNVESNREFVQNTSQITQVVSSNFSVAYHGITHIISGSISNSSNNTSSLQLLQQIDKEYILLKTGRVEGDGQFEFTAYDDTTNYIVTGYVTSSLKGISKLDIPGENFDIDLSPAGGTGGEFFF